MSENLHVVCVACDAINRIPVARLPQHPRCGQCRAELFQAKPLALSDASFDRHIGRNDIPVLVDFWADWCGPCRSMAPAFEQAAGLLEPTLRLAKLDTEAAPATAARFGIRSLPTLALFRQGKEVARQPGAMGTADIVGWVRAQRVDV